MPALHPRIRTALVSIDPNGQRPAWHGAPTALGVLRGVRAPAALWRPYPEANNIREITLHIAFWENSVANRLAGTSQRLLFAQRKTGWPLRSDELEESQWKEEVALLRTVHARLVEAVTAFDPARLDEPPGSRTTRPAIQLIHGVGEHSLHHATQIEMLKQLQRRA